MFFRVLLTIFYHIFLKSGAKVRKIKLASILLHRFFRISTVCSPHLLCVLLCFRRFGSTETFLQILSDTVTT